MRKISIKVRTIKEQDLRRQMTVIDIAFKFLKIKIDWKAISERKAVGIELSNI